ncbi:hypothetical protein H2248_010662 [Termitomyces sp. 'cryptogamus']|nr:hypothetical protein H2248_010662 [Termitomyces sp. 'cryptogamus']
MAAQKRLVSTAAKIASVSTAHLPRFPPREAIFKHSEIPKPPFAPETWASTRPPPPSALSAFAHRIGLASVLSTSDSVLRVCTHSSFPTLQQQFAPDERKVQTNAQLAPLGNALLGLFATEFIHTAYPHLPTRVLKAAVSAQVGTQTCAAVAQEMGAAPLLRWHRSDDVSHSDALASVPRAITALIYEKLSLLSARQFVHSYFLSREIDLRGMIKFRHPKIALLEMIKKLNREYPKSRLLKETGRYSNSPIFVVGIYSGADKLGEGFGSSLRMAEYRAAEDALHRVYLTRVPNHLMSLPTSTFPTGLGSVFKVKGKEKPHTPADLGMAEVEYGRSGRSSAGYTD